MNYSSETLLADARKAVSLMAIQVLRDERSVQIFRHALAHQFAKTVAARTIQQNPLFLRATFPLKVRVNEVLEEPNPIWAQDEFILPAVLSLSAFFDAVLSTDGHSTFQITTQECPPALYGRIVSGIHAMPGLDRHRFVLMVSGAAKAFLTDPDMLQLSTWTLGVFGERAVRDVVPC